MRVVSAAQSVFMATLDELQQTGLIEYGALITCMWQRCRTFNRSGAMQAVQSFLCPFLAARLYGCIRM